MERNEDVLGLEAKTSLMRIASSARLFRPNGIMPPQIGVTAHLQGWPGRYMLTQVEKVMQGIVGIDVSKEQLDIYGIFGDNTRRKVVENSEAGFKALHSWLLKANVEDLHVCMEATGCYFEGVAEFFHNL